MASYYDNMVAWPAGPPPGPEAQRLVLDKHRPPATPLQQSRQQLESRERVLLRELRTIEKELATMREQLAPAQG